MELQVTAARLTGNVQEDVKRLSNYVFQLEENMRYLLRNLDVTNFNDLGLARYENGRLQVYTEALKVKTEELKVQLGAETDEIYAMISATAEELSAEIETVDGKYAGLKLTLDGLQSTVSSQDTMIKNGYATLQSQITQQANAISLVVDSSGNVTPASIVAKINEAGSEVKIEAEHVALSGDYVTVEDLKDGGKVTIDGGNISGGVIEGTEFYSEGPAPTGDPLDIAYTRIAGGVIELGPWKIYEAVGDLWVEANSNRTSVQFVIGDATWSFLPDGIYLNGNFIVGEN